MILHLFSLFFMLILKYTFSIQGSMKMEQKQIYAGCTKEAWSRGLGNTTRFCATGYEAQGGKCFPKCPEGFTGVRSDCFKNCPKNFTDNGEACLKPSIYGRGAGYVIWDEEKCKKENPIGCEKWGLLWYPKCEEGFVSSGCCICSPVCPANMKEIGSSCVKNSYSRGDGIPMICSKKEDFFRGFCFLKCPQGYQSDGPVCLKPCPMNYFDCGWFCMRNKFLCNDSYRQFRDKEMPLLVIKSKEMSFGEKIDILKSVDANFYLPTCT